MYFNIVLFVAINIAFNGYIMKEYTVEYQTEEEAVAEMHRTSVMFLKVVIVFAFMLYIFH